jgi:arylalkylamine N-acetyltransferase
VDESQRRKGIASRMLRAYVLMVQHTLPELKAIRLICKKELIGLYSAAEFQMVGPSDVEHGKDQWYEMSMQLSEEDS